MPPPGTMPSSTAARVALIASSMSCTRRFCSTGVAPPARITAVPPDSLARRSWYLSRSMFCGAASYWRDTCSRRALTAAGSPAPAWITVWLADTTTCRAPPRSRICTAPMRPPRSRAITRPPVAMAMSSSMARRQCPYSGGWIAATGGSSRSRRDSRATTQAGATSSARISSGRFCPAINASIAATSSLAVSLQSVIRISGSSSTTNMRSTSVTMWCDR